MEFWGGIDRNFIEGLHDRTPLLGCSVSVWLDGVGRVGVRFQPDAVFGELNDRWQGQKLTPSGH